MSRRVDEDAFEEARYYRLGWCPECEDFTSAGVPLRAAGAHCPSCYGDRVVGLMTARRGDFLEVIR